MKGRAEARKIVSPAESFRRSESFRRENGDGGVGGKRHGADHPHHQLGLEFGKSTAMKQRHLGRLFGISLRNLLLLFLLVYYYS